MASTPQTRSLGLHTRRAEEIFYPEEDGKPMAESGPHVLTISMALLSLRYWFRKREDVYVGANMFVYYVQGDPRRNVTPDVFVAEGVSNEQRGSYKIWEEGQAPLVTIEFTSSKTRNEDFRRKRDIYAQLGVAEYFLFDPYGQDLDPPLLGFRLEEGRYVEMQLETLPPLPATNGDVSGGDAPLHGWRVKSEKLGLGLWATPSEASKSPYILRFSDSVSGQWLIDPEQALVENEMLKKRLRESHQKEVALLEAEIAEQQARLEALSRGESTDSRD